MTAAKRQPPESKPSFLLSPEENETLFRLIGSRCKGMASAVVQVLLSDSSQWIKHHCGVLCFVKDNVKRSYFFRLYSIERQVMLWEQELYINFDYKSPRPYFHTFEGDNCRIGFNFAAEAEAAFYLAAVQENLRQKAEKRERRRVSSTQSLPQPHQEANKISSRNGSSTPTINANPASASSSRLIPSFPNKKNKKDKKKLTKADISLPSDFKHVSHVGWDPNKGFALDNVEPDLLQFFAKAGVSEEHLQDKATREFIYDFIDKHGGMRAAIREVSMNGSLLPPPVPTRNPPTPQTTRTAPPPTPVANPPPPPSRMVASPPPQPPPQQQQQRGPPPPSKSAPVPPASIPPPPPMNSAPPPPPPPPPATSAPVPPGLPPTATAPPATSSQPDPRNALMEAIKGGPKLRAVDTEPRPKIVTDSRTNLLGQIRAGVELKPVENQVKRNSTNSDDAMDGMAGALARALQERSRVIHSDSDSSADENEDDDDWDD